MPDIDDRVLTLPGLTTPDNRVAGVQFAGYASIYGAGERQASEPDEGLFYWFVGDDDYAKRPTVLWTNGGPGSSSFWGFFLENGPYDIESAVGAYPVVRPSANGWNQFANYMIFEHPLSVTLSFAEDEKDIPKSVEEGTAQYYRALQNFLAKHPEIAENPIILAGESYAGTYLPLLAQAILEGNKKSKNISIDLRSMVLLDAWVSPEVQMRQDTNYALAHGLISATQKAELDKEYRDLNPKPGKKGLGEINGAIAAIAGVYMANIAEQSDPPFDPVLLYLNRDDVRDAIHAKKGVALTDTWSPQISKNYEKQVNDSYAHVVQRLLNRYGLQTLVISGLNDAKDCNFLGTGAWLAKLRGKPARRFQAAKTTQWKDPVVGRVLGYEQNGGELRWLKVLDAGHLAVRDQPLIIDYILEAAL
jgi:vitellogenic carboxypeptidase-like protein